MKLLFIPKLSSTITCFLVVRGKREGSQGRKEEEKRREEVEKRGFLEEGGAKNVREVEKKGVSQNLRVEKRREGESEEEMKKV